jgi:hypothetical protein
MSSLMVRKISVMEEDWDHLVVLDGCRYDFFFRLYPAYFEGELERVLSTGSNTVEWRDSSFPGRYGDVVYVSANPYINSRVAVKDFDARDHFHEVVDVWDWGWDPGLGTVPPGRVNEAAIASIERHPGKRLIVHYLQPHCPYLGHQPPGSGYPRQTSTMQTFLDGTIGGGRRPSLRQGLLDLAKALARNPVLRDLGMFSEGSLWRMRESLGLPPESPMDAARREFGEGGLREAYAMNLQIVLAYISSLLEDLSGTIVVTSDHGERLGEGGRFSHGYGLKDRLLLEIPWLVMRR